MLSFRCSCAPVAKRDDAARPCIISTVHKHSNYYYNIVISRTAWRGGRRSGCFVMRIPVRRCTETTGGCGDGTSRCRRGDEKYFNL